MEPKNKKAPEDQTEAFLSNETRFDSLKKYTTKGPK